MSKKSGGTSVGSKPNHKRKAKVSRIFGDQPSWTVMGLRRIIMTTEDGLSTPNDGWCNSAECKVHEEKFKKTWQDYKSGVITAGTEVTVEYDANGVVLCFYL